MTPSWAIENATPDDLAMTPVAAAVPGPQTTRAAVPMNSAATFRERDASALDAICRPATSRHAETAGPQLLKRGPACRYAVRLSETRFRRSLRRGDGGVNGLSGRVLRSPGQTGMAKGPAVTERSDSPCLPRPGPATTPAPWTTRLRR